MPNRVCVAAGLCIAVAACGESHGAIAGDVFETREGEIYRLSGGELRVLVEPDSVLRAVARGCDAALPLRDRLQKARWPFDSVASADGGLLFWVRNDLAEYKRRRAVYEKGQPFRDSMALVDRQFASGLDSIFAVHTRAASQSDINAHFVIDSVPPGDYLILAYGDDYRLLAGRRERMGTQRWLARARVTAGDTARANLSRGGTDIGICYTEPVSTMRLSNQ